MSTYRYVIHERVPDYLLCGWLATPALEGTHHGFYSVLMAWLCDCPTTEPTKHRHSPTLESKP